MSSEIIATSTERSRTDAADENSREMDSALVRYQEK